MNPYLPYVDLVFRLTCPILKFKQSLLEAQSRRRIFTAWAACRCAYRSAVMLQDRLEAAIRFLEHINIQEHTVKRVNTFKYLGSTLAEDG